MGPAEIMAILESPKAAKELARSYIYGHEGGDIKLAMALLTELV
jgi:hypothetical protein